METASTVFRVPLTDILALYKAGFSLPDISLCTGVKLRTVQRWVKRYRDNGGEELSNMQVRCGRKGICSPEVLEEIQRQLQINPRVTARQLQDANPALLSGLSLRTIQRWLREDMGVTRNSGWRKYYDLVLTKEEEEVSIYCPSMTPVKLNIIVIITDTGVTSSLENVVGAVLC